MGYIIGGSLPKSQIIASSTEQDFKQARQTSYVQLPPLEPKRSAISLNTVQNSRAKQASGVTDVTRTAPLFNDPRYTSSTLSIPTDDRTLHGLYRFFSETDPIVGSAIRIHTELPLADLSLGTCEDTGIQLHFEEMWERINGLKLLSDITTEYHEVGNVFPFGAFNEADYMWDQFAILNPDYVKIETTWVNSRPLIKLIPDEALKKVVQTQSPRFIYEQLPPEIIRYVLFNQEIPLDPNNVFHLAHAKRPYEARGKSIIKRILKTLMLEDRFNQANFALATRHAVPLTIVKVGDPTTGWVPDQGEIDSVRDTFCYDEKTEVLTDSGFKKYVEVLSKDKIACFNQDTKEIEYHIPLLKHEFLYEGEMLHFKSSSSDILVTPNHRMFVEREGRWGSVLAQDVSSEDRFRVRDNSEKPFHKLSAQEFSCISIPQAIREYYKGLVWCFTVPTGYFVTRRNNCITIQGNSAYELDPNFCYDEQTECLTDQGWKKYTELSYKQKVASFNPETNGLEYHTPSLITLQDYKGEMIHIKRRTTDIKVTPNHRMWIQRQGQWQVVHAENLEPYDILRTAVERYEGKKIPDTIEIAGKKVSSYDWYEFVGWYLAEGSVYYNKQWESFCSVTIAQKKNASKKRIRRLLERLPWVYQEDKNGFRINNRVFAEYVIDTFKSGSDVKHIPQDMLQADTEHLRKILEAWLDGDGTIYKQKHGNIAYVGASASIPLIDAMQEICIKLGYSARKSDRKITSVSFPEAKYNGSKRVDGTDFLHMYFLYISRHSKSTFPVLRPKREIERSVEVTLDSIPMKGKRVDWDKVDLQEMLVQSAGAAAPIARALNVTIGTVLPRLKELGFTPTIGGQSIRGGKKYRTIIQGVKKEKYDGKIWCVSVPTGIIVTRRNGKVAVQGQTIFYHYGINVEFYGSNGKMLPIGPELDRIYRLKFIGLNIHEQLLSGQGGSYSQAYVNLEIQRQRYLNLQLKLETFMHQGVFKPVADLCGFYRIKQAVAGYAGVSSHRYGTRDEMKQQILKQFGSVRDYQDNREFQEFLNTKAQEIQNKQTKQVREYIYPKLDWGALSAATDENLKNYLKWLAKERPWLVDDATLARMARLDRDTQEKAYMEDLKRKAKRYSEIAKQGLLAFVPKGKGGDGGGDLGGIGDITLGPPGGGDMGGNLGMEGGGEPNAPIGQGGPPAAAEGAPPAGMTQTTSLLLGLEKEVSRAVTVDDLIITAENKELQQKKQEFESKAILGTVEGRV